MTALLERLQDPAYALGFVDVPDAITHDHGLSVDFVSAEAWDALTVQFRDVVHEQTECFNAVRWSPEQRRRLIFRDGAEIVGAVLARVIRFPLLGTPLVVVRWGPLWRKFGEADRPDVLLRIYQALREELADKIGGFMLIMPHTDAERTNTPATFLEQCRFKPGPEHIAPERYFVNVAIDPEAVRMSFAQKWRYNLKKSEKNGLTADFVDGVDGIRQFKELYGAMQDRKRFLDHSPIDTLESLAEAENPDLRPRTIIVKKDGEAVAGAVIDVSGERAAYLFGATTDRALPLKAGYFMQWEIVKLLTAMPKVRWYDLGAGSSKTCSLHQFKRGMVGKAGVVADMAPYYTYAPTIRAALAGSIALKSREVMDFIQAILHGPKQAMKAG